MINEVLREYWENTVKWLTDDKRSIERILLSDLLMINEVLREYC